MTTTKINWLTAADVEREAKKGPEAALAVSELHWFQLSSATLEQLEERFGYRDELHNYITAIYCGLCKYYYDDCDKPETEDKCPLDCNTGCGNWNDVDGLFRGDKSIAEIYPAFHRTSTILYEKIKALT